MEGSEKGVGILKTEEEGNLRSGVDILLDRNVSFSSPA
jgi:hypothetical protein